MPRRPVPKLLCLACALAALVGSAAGAPAAGASEANPFADQGSNYNYRSYITAVRPQVKGLELQILEFADRLELTNHTGETVTIYGYQGEPYARVLANGTAERNVRSPATYLNESFYADVKVPPIANPKAPPEWRVVDRTGFFEWHDHRIHWPTPTLPPEVKDKSRRTLIFDWAVPIEVGSRKGAIVGALYWVPESSKTPLAAIILGAVIVLAGLLFVIYVRRRRARGGPTRAGGEPAATAGGTGSDAW
jgi:hypothetical protein